MTNILTQKAEAYKKRILSKIQVDPITKCWNWTGCVRGKKSQYGQFFMGSRLDGSRTTTNAHRVSYRVFVGPIAEGLFVCHKCDNPKCVNPEHLFLGTPKDNMTDMWRKGRGRQPPRVTGENHGATKFNWEQVKEIRSLSKHLTRQEIAKLFGCSWSCIDQIVRYARWKDEPLPQSPQGER